MQNQRDGKRDERRDRKPAKPKENVARVKGKAADADGLGEHGAKIDRFAPPLDQNRNVLTVLRHLLISAAQ